MDLGTVEHYLDVQLRECHEETIRQPKQQAADVYGVDVGCYHHDDIRNTTQEAGGPDARLAAHE